MLACFDVLRIPDLRVFRVRGMLGTVFWGRLSENLLRQQETN